MASNSPQPTSPGLLRQVGLFDATMIVMGGIVGAGIFINPYVVAQQVHTPRLILGVWIAGGVVAMLGAFVYAELAARRPAVGGQYAYLREAFHPVVGFLYGWVLLLVIQTGGMAAVTVTFARYLLELTGWQVSERLIVVLTIVRADRRQLPGREAGQPHAERPDAAEDRCHRWIDRRRSVPGALAASVAASGAGSPAVAGPADRGRRGDGSGAVCLWRMADVRTSLPRRSKIRARICRARW